MKFYAIEYRSSTKTGCTTGEPNGRTGRMSIACDIEAFGSKTERADWIDGGSCDRPRISISKTTARAHCLGLSVAEFNDYLESVDV